MRIPHQVAPDSELNMTGKDAEIVETEPGVKLRRWTRDEYYRAAEMGLFLPDEHLELLNGVIYQKMPEKPSHMTITKLVNAALVAAFAGQNAHVTQQHAVVMPGESEPEPDVSVLIGSIRDYEDHHPVPNDVLLLVEASNTTLRFDRNTKRRVYATAGIREYWIVNLAGRCVEVHRDPQNGTYHSEKTYQEQDSIAPLAAPGKSILVADLLPRATLS